MRTVRFLVLPLLVALALAGWGKTISILATGDMHGYLVAQPREAYSLGGAAEMLAAWQRAEGYTPEKFLVLSAGDIASVRPVSALTTGDSTIAAMNLMGYDATAIGNHEFDMKVPKLREWQAAAKFPFLAANLTKRDGGAADIAKPYLLVEQDGVKVAVIGLTMQGLRAHSYASDYAVLKDVDVLRKYVPEVREQGAAVVVVLAHAGQAELVELALQVKDLNIALMIGGHDHQAIQQKVGDTWVVDNGFWFHAYARIDLEVDVATGKAWVASSKLAWVLGKDPAADPALAADIAKWRGEGEGGQ